MFTKSPNHNINYLASIVDIQSFRPHSNADRLKIATIYGNNVITGIAASEGLFCYFPLESALSSDFLSYTNSFRDKELNRDKNVASMFESHGRVRALRLRGEKSEGYMVPISVLEDFVKNFLGLKISSDDFKVGTDFDTVGDHQICRKYIPKGTRQQSNSSKKTKGNVKKYQSKLVENQFRFHPSTEQLKRNSDKISPNDYIYITEKYHGTSFVVSNVLVKKILSFKDKIFQYFGAKIVDTEYGMLYSSRSVLKNQNMDKENNNDHFYDSDVWKIVADKIYPCLKKGYSVYGEIVGYTPTGSMIQKDYDYGCQISNLDYLIYRMTYTNVDGDVFELSPNQLEDYCSRYGLKIPLVHYNGRAKELYPELCTDNSWNDNFLKLLEKDYLEKDCIFCKSKPNIPAEGIIVRIDKPNTWEVYKLKSFRFLQKESDSLDAGILDMETSQNLDIE